MEFYTHLTEDLLTEMAEIGRYNGLQIKYMALRVLFLTFILKILKERAASA